MTSAPDVFLPDLVRWEGLVPWMYLDSKGLVTVAIGHLLSRPEDAAALPFARDGVAVPSAIARAAWQVVHGADKGYVESHYAAYTSLRLTDQQCRDIASSRLAFEFLPALKRKIPGFDSAAPSIQRAIVDIAWNYGCAGLFATHTLFPQLVANDWKMAAETCLRLDSRAERNEWRRELFLQPAR